MRYHIKLKSWGDNEILTKVVPDIYKKFFGYDNIEISTDSNGFITYDSYVENKNKIIILGDSFVENMYVEKNLRFCALLSQKLNYKYSILNSGMSGSSILNLYNLFLNKIVPLKPILLIIFPGAISADCDRQKGTFWNRCKDYSNFTDSTEKRNYVGSNNFVEFLNILKIFVYSCNIFNIKLIISSTPYNFSNERRMNIDKMNCICHDFCKNNNVYFIDSLKEFETTNNYFYDQIHLNIDGSKKMADILFKYINIYLNNYKVA